MQLDSESHLTKGVYDIFEKIMTIQLHTRVYNHLS